MRRPPSLALRLTLLFGGAAALVFFGFGWVIERSIEHHFSAEDTAELNVIARAVSQALTRPHRAEDTIALEQRFSDILVGHHSAALFIKGHDGHTLFASPGSLDFSALNNSVADGVVRLWRDPQYTYRVLTRRMSNSAGLDDLPYTVSVAVAIDYHLHFLDSFRRTLWIMIASGIVVTGLMGWVAVRQGHIPLRNIVAQIRRISANELNTRLSPATVPRELTDLAISFNEMLARMEESFQQLANFSADIAHELRTPVTNLLTQTQVALSQSRNVGDYREILYSNIEEYERMAQMIGEMLFLAKADNGLYPLNTIEIDLAREVQDLFEYYEAWAEDRGVALNLRGDAKVRADRLMLRRALSNLLSNAIRHTPAGNTVQVILDQTPGREISIVVENPGAAIPPEHLSRLFNRFYRVDASRHRSDDGAGLGLAIVKSIVDLHDGKIEVSSSTEGTRFRINLPD
ncbi:MAG: heavy metal sensor histidine kinase [Pseudomonadota bacterium]